MFSVYMGPEALEFVVSGVSGFVSWQYVFAYPSEFCFLPAVEYEFVRVDNPPEIQQYQDIDSHLLGGEG